jgi:hypothetical protein
MLGTDRYFKGRVELAIYAFRAGIPRARFDTSREGAYIHSLIGFFASNRSESRLYALVLTELIYTHSLRIPVVLAYASGRTISELLQARGVLSRQ